MKIIDIVSDEELIDKIKSLHVLRKNELLNSLISEINYLDQELRRNKVLVAKIKTFWEKEDEKLYSTREVYLHKKTSCKYCFIVSKTSISFMNITKGHVWKSTLLLKDIPDQNDYEFISKNVFDQLTRNLTDEFYVSDKNL